MGLVIFGGVKKIAKFNLRIVSLMGSLFLSLGLFIIIKNISLIPNIFISILKEAFNFKSLSGGFLYTLVIGFQRGIFASEAGLGTSSISSAMTNDSDFDITFYKNNLTEMTELTEEEYNETEVISVFVCSQVTEKLINKFKNLRIIATRSTGYNHIDIHTFYMMYIPNHSYKICCLCNLEYVYQISPFLYSMLIHLFL